MIQLKFSILLTALAVAVGCGAPVQDAGDDSVPIVGGPCEGCDAVFDGIPAELSSTVNIVPAEKGGEQLRIKGRVTHCDGTPASGTIVYAYHTNSKGIYPKDENVRGMPAYRHGTLRGWAEADNLGRYSFETIRPAGYPNSDMPQHIHMHVIEPERCTYYIDDIVFRDDPRLTRETIKQYQRHRGGSGVVMPRREDNTWFVTRDIVLGKGIPEYDSCRADSKMLVKRD